jgi:hypothetical protein
MSEQKVFKSCEDYWNNKPGTVLRSAFIYNLGPLRVKVHDENIKGEFSEDMLDIDKLVRDTEVAHRGRSLVNGDVFEFVELDTVIPWMEAITGCHLYALGKGSSMVANPPDVAPEDLPGHLRGLLDNLEGSVWYRKLRDGYRGLAEVLGDTYPLCQTLMRGPGDMVGAMLGHEKFIGMMLDAGKKGFLHELLDLSSRIYIETAKMQLDNGGKFRGGYCNPFGIWAPDYNVRSQEDEASLVSPKMYNEFFLPYHIQEVAKYKYSTFHMHSGYVMTTYNWREFIKRGNVGSFEVAMDPNGPTAEALMPSLVEMNRSKPVVIDSCTAEQIKAIEEHISEFPGAVLHRDLDIATFSFQEKQK